MYIERGLFRHDRIEQFMCNETVANSINADDVFCFFFFLLTKQKIPVTGGKGKTGSCATPLETASKIAVAKSVLRSFVHLIFNSKQKLKIMIN